MDVWVNFKNATKWQAEGIFKCFFPSKPSGQQQQHASPSSPSLSASNDPRDPTSQENLAVPKRKRNIVLSPQLSEEEIAVLAKRFAEAIPEDEFSVSSNMTRVLMGIAKLILPRTGGVAARLLTQEQDASEGMRR